MHARPRPIFRTDAKSAGLLVPAFALRHDHDLGIGDTRAVREAIDFCAAHDLAVLQLLPIHETIGDHSPYNPISARALAPSLLYLVPAEVPGLTDAIVRDAAPDAWQAELRAGPVKHGAVHALKRQILFAAFANFEHVASDEQRAEFAAFQQTNADWLRPYTLFRVLVEHNGGNPHWPDWQPTHREPTDAEGWMTAAPDATALAAQRRGFAYIQWVAWRQWTAVRAHAGRRGVALMGEMSFGVSRSGADVWAHPELFEAEWNMGTPPIAYFDTNKDSERWGQNWGLPPYRWEAHRAPEFAWLRARLCAERQFFHCCRLDHLRGYFRGYMFPWKGGAEHAEFATLTNDEAWQRTGGLRPRFVPGADDDPDAVPLNDRQGREVIAILQDAAGEMELVGEIMGHMPAYIRQAIDDLQMPNLVFPQLERAPDGSLLPPDQYRTLSLASFANHDHAPLAARYAHLVAECGGAVSTSATADLRNLLHLAGWKAAPPAAFHDDLLGALQHALLACPCRLAMFLSSDLLGTTQRFNLPGTHGPDTWNERLELPFDEYASHPVFGPRLARVREWIRETGRAPDERASPEPRHFPRGQPRAARSSDESLP